MGNALVLAQRYHNVSRFVTVRPTDTDAHRRGCAACPRAMLGASAFSVGASKGKECSDTFKFCPLPHDPRIFHVNSTLLISTKVSRVYVRWNLRRSAEHIHVSRGYSGFQIPQVSFLLKARTQRLGEFPAKTWTKRTLLHIAQYI